MPSDDYFYNRLSFCVEVFATMPSYGASFTTTTATRGNPLQLFVRHGDWTHDFIASNVFIFRAINGDVQMLEMRQRYNYNFL